MPKHSSGILQGCSLFGLDGLLDFGRIRKTFAGSSGSLCFFILHGLIVGEKASIKWAGGTHWEILDTVLWARLSDQHHETVVARVHHGDLEFKSQHPHHIPTTSLAICLSHWEENRIDFQHASSAAR